MKTPTNLNPTQTKNLLNKNNILLVDIREPEEYNYEHITDAKSIPLSHIQQKEDLPADPNEIIFYCQSGMRSTQSASRLASLSDANIYLLEGGLNAWKKAGLPVEKNAKQPLPIMRQVQITAGSLILLGVSLGYGLSNGYFLIPGFIGVGLLFAGISGWCGMAKLLARMPWNRNNDT